MHLAYTHTHTHMPIHKVARQLNFLNPYAVMRMPLSEYITEEIFKDVHSDSTAFKVLLEMSERNSTEITFKTSGNK